MPEPREPKLGHAEIASRVRALGRWFHNLDLEGIATAPDHFLGNYPTVKWQKFADALPRDLQGKSVLDVGCNAGFYCFEMKRRGAARVLGIDTSPEYLEQARFAAEVLRVNVEFRQLSTYQVGKLNERFDLVLFMGVLYHLRHPLLALDLLYEHVVGDTLVYQSLQRGAEATSAPAADYPFSETAVFEQPGFPRLHFVEHAYASDETNWWIPNAPCSEAMLRSAGFTIVKRAEPEVYICRRREHTGAQRLSEDVPEVA